MSSVTPLENTKSFLKPDNNSINSSPQKLSEEKLREVAHKNISRYLMDTGNFDRAIEVATSIPDEKEREVAHKKYS